MGDVQVEEEGEVELGWTPSLSPWWSVLLFLTGQGGRPCLHAKKSGVQIATPPVRIAQPPLSRDTNTAQHQLVLTRWPLLSRPTMIANTESEL